MKENVPASPPIVQTKFTYNYCEASTNVIECDIKSLTIFQFNLNRVKAISGNILFEKKKEKMLRIRFPTWRLRGRIRRKHWG